MTPAAMKGSKKKGWILRYKSGNMMAPPKGLEPLI